MDVQFAPVLADASAFPPAIVKATPSLSLVDLFRFSGVSTNNFIYTRNGRAALGIAAGSLQFTGCKNVILLPAYHCPALIEPFLWQGYEVRFYPVKEDLFIDEAHFSNLLTEDVTHCVLVRFFGFNQNVDSVISLAAKAGKVVIEDSAHGLIDYILNNGRANSQVAARICSINKIIPTLDGGLLQLAERPAQLPANCSWLDELKAVAYLLKLPQLLRGMRKTKPTALPIKESEVSRQRYKYFDPADLTTSSFRLTKQILKSSNLNTIRLRRQQNYRYLVQNLSSSNVGNCLYPHISNESPYVLPFLLNDAALFSELRKQKIQVLRWEEVALSDCAVSQSYRSRLIQLPCHHKLSQQQLDYIIMAVKSLEKDQ